MSRPANRYLFRFHRGGALNKMLKDTFKKCGLSFPRRQGGFHLFCHTYGTWMSNYANLDNYGLTRTKRVGAIVLFINGHCAHVTEAIAWRLLDQRESPSVRRRSRPLVSGP